MARSPGLGGYLFTAAELAQRGHQVLWASEARIAPHVERAGVPFCAIECIGWRLQTALTQQDLAELAAEERSSLRFRRALDAWLSQDWVERGARELIALTVGKYHLCWYSSRSSSWLQDIWSRSTAFLVSFLVSGNLARTNAGKDATEGKDNKWNPNDDGCYH